MTPSFTPAFASPEEPAVPLRVIAETDLDTALDALDPMSLNWARTTSFRGTLGSARLLPDAEGRLTGALLGFGTPAARARERFALAKAIVNLPEGTYRLEGLDDPDDLAEAALGWLLASYRFTRYAGDPPRVRRLVAPEGVDAERLIAIATGEILTRDLINTPAVDMGPQELADAACALADQTGGSASVVAGGELLEQNYPLIHTVGRASPRQPRLIELSWPGPGPHLVLVGKGVCFDTGGLNLKGSTSMALMKKDMGGAAMVLGLARMIRDLDLPLRLTVLIPAVENAVAGSAFRPGDILPSRSGQTVEINNTDAEGRLVLADALTRAGELAPDLTVSMATLTGAARVAVGPDIAPFFATEGQHADALRQAGTTVRDPVWELPFHAPYESMIEPGIADLDNAPSGGFAGAITAALFLKRFAPEGPYLHFDCYGWQPWASPARPKGGVGQGTRAILEALPGLLGL